MVGTHTINWEGLTMGQTHFFLCCQTPPVGISMWGLDGAGQGLPRTVAAAEDMNCSDLSMSVILPQDRQLYALPTGGSPASA